VIASGGHGFGLAVFPLAAGAIAAVFGAMLIRRFADRRRPHEGVWAAALLMFAAASFAMFLGVVRGWQSSDFRVYWLFGAILNVPFLAQGEVYLLVRSRRAGHLVFACVLALAVFAAWKVSTATIDPVPLTKTLPLGKEVFGDGSAPYRLSQLYAFPAYFFLLGGSVWSALKMKGRPELRNRTAGAVGIALGATVVAVGSGVGAGFGIVPLFSVGLALGIGLMFWGFLRSSRPAARSPKPV
jgi:hypothetical protein